MIKKRMNNPKIVKLFMNILFVLTIASIFGAMITMNATDELFDVNGFNYTKSTIVFWWWLPIPILSVILGKRYNKMGYKFDKNVTAGYIMAVLLFLFGCFSMTPTFEEDYSKIDKYREFVAVSLPENGQLEIIEWTDWKDKNILDYTSIIAYYDDVDTSELEKDIQNSDKWILSNDLNNELKMFITGFLQRTDYIYYSIYNETTKEYNTIPENDGIYNIYVMKYDNDLKEFRIDKLEYSIIDQIDEKNKFIGTILEVHDKSIIIEPANGTTERKSSDKIIIKRINKDVYAEGDKVKVTYDGLINESYPAQISAIEIELLK